MDRKLTWFAIFAVGVLAADENEDEVTTGKLVAWIITAVVSLVLLGMLLTSYICSKMVETDKKTENKQFARAMSMSSMMRSNLKKRVKIASVLSPKSGDIEDSER